MADLAPRPAAVPWDAAGALFSAGSTAWAAVRAVGASPGDVIVISGAAGGVGTMLAQLIADGKLEIPIADTYPLEHVRDAYRELEQRHTLGKIVLHP